LERPDWDEYYLGIALAVSARGECVRSKVGAVIVSPTNSIVSTGYNGAPAGTKGTCLEGGCPRAYNVDIKPGSGYASSGCVVIHAEANAIIRAGRDTCVGSTLYVTREPCEMCHPLIRAAGIERVMWING